MNLVTLRDTPIQMIRIYLTVDQGSTGDNW